MLGTTSVTRTILAARAPTGHELPVGRSRDRAVVATHHGDLLPTADGMLDAVFPNAGDAVRAAVELRDRHSVDGDDGLRVGVAVGDVHREGDDWVGPPVTVADHLRNLAVPGEILTTTGVALVAGDGLDAPLIGVGTVEIDGRDVGVLRLGSTAPARSAARFRFPSTLSVRSGRPFVARREQIAALAEAWDAAQRGEAALVMVGGEAGAGKTRLAAEFCAARADEGALVVAGVCDSNLALPYQPWMMVVEQLVEQLPDDVLGALADELTHLSVLVPSLERYALDRRPQTADPETARHRLFRGVRLLLAAGSRLAPTLVVLDDLHWAGQQTLAVLQYLARTAPLEHVLVVGTFRDTPADGSGPLAATLAELRRVDHAARLSLPGLDAGDVRELLECAGIGEAGARAAIADTVTERTRGNPFLVWELAARADDTAGVVPDSVRDVVAARLAGFTAPARHLADVLALSPGRMESAVAAEAARLDPRELGDALADVLASGLIEELPGPAATVRYSHALFRDAVVELMPGITQARLHLAIAEALERAHGSDPRIALADLTRHFTAAAAVGGRERAAHYGRLAAAQARRTAAYDEAIDLIEITLQVLAIDTHDHARLLLDQLDLLQRSGRLREALMVGERAYQAAARLGDLELSAAAAVGFERATHVTHDFVARQRAEVMLDAVLRIIPDRDSPLRAKVRAASGHARVLSGDTAAAPLVQQALAEARRTGDEEAIAFALEAATTTTLEPEEALTVTEELEALTIDRGDVWRSMWATGNRTRILLELGRLTQARDVLRRHTERSQQFRFLLFRFQCHVFESTLALSAGELDRAEEEIEAVETLGEHDELMPSHGVHGLQMFMIRREQGRLHEMRPVLDLLRASSADAGVWGPGLAVSFAELGMLTDARRIYDQLRPDRFVNVARDALWPVSLAFLAETCLLLDDRSGAAQLLEELEAFRGRVLCAGFSSCAGATDRLRAGLAELVDEPELADELLSDAIAWCAEIGAPVWQAQAERVGAWIDDRRGDQVAAAQRRKRAARLLDAGRPPPEEAGSPDVRPVAITADGLSPGLSPRELEVLALVADGRSNRDIAAALFISPNTAANHVRAILQKTASANRTEAAAYAHRHGLTSTP